MGKLIFVLGGARGGKSAFAEQLAAQMGKNILYVATAQALDDDMQARIVRHRQERSPDWHTLEVPLNAAEALRRYDGVYDVLLLDCLTLLATNIMLSLPEDAPTIDMETAFLAEIDALLELQRNEKAIWIVVSNEVGMGVVPPTVLGRAFRDVLGRGNQRLARAAQEVVLMIAGLPWYLKPYDTR